MTHPFCRTDCLSDTWQKMLLVSQAKALPCFIRPRTSGGQRQKVSPVYFRFIQTTNIIQLSCQMIHYIRIIGMMIKCTLKRGNGQLRLAQFNQ